LDAEVAVLEAFVVPSLADAPLDALRLSAAVPEVVDVLPPLDDGLLNDELPTDVEEPFVPADAVLEVVLWLDVSLLLLAPFAAELSLAAADLTLLAVFAPLEVEASVVEWVLFALLEAEDVFVEDALLLALELSAAFLLAVVAKVRLLVEALLSVFDRLSVAEWFREALTVAELVLLLVTSDDFVSVYWLFSPRL
jgi:hypothetical protein